MKLLPIETLLLQEMEDVKGGVGGTCKCESGAGQGEDNEGTCVCTASGAAQVISPTRPPHPCRCDTGAAQSA